MSVITFCLVQNASSIFRRFYHAIRKAGLTHYVNRPIYTLSGGLKQRVALVRAFINHPPLLMLDESFGALDNHTRAEMHTLLFDLWRATQNAMIIITHDIDEALFLGQQIVVINGHPGTIKAEYKNSFSNSLSAKPMQSLLI